MKRMTALFILIAMIVVILPAQVGAIGDSYADSDANVTVITPTAFQQMFSSSSVDSIWYDYSMNIVDEDLSQSLVSIQIELVIAGDRHYITTQGCVQAYPLPSGDVFWEGPTEGTFIIGDREYIVIAAFSKLDSSDSPMIVITIQGDEVPTVGFYFGNNQINNEVQGIISQQGQFNSTASEVSQIDTVLLEDNSADGIFSIRDDIVQVNPFDSDPVNLGPNYEWDYKGCSFAGFAITGVSGFGLHSHAYFWPETNRLAITTKSYCSNVSMFYNSIPTCIASYTSISEFSVAVDMGEMDGTNCANIIGIVSYGFSETDIGKWGRALKPLFEELMSSWDYGSAIISALLDTLVGRIDTYIYETGYVDSSSIKISFGLFDFADFDESIEGVPLVFALGRASNSYVGGTPVTVTITMKYRTYIYDQINGDYFYMYTNAENAVLDLSLDLG